MHQGISIKANEDLLITHEAQESHEHCAQHVTTDECTIKGGSAMVCMKALCPDFVSNSLLGSGLAQRLGPFAMTLVENESLLVIDLTDRNFKRCWLPISDQLTPRILAAVRAPNDTH